MDYQKIYSAFIASRKCISHARDAYTEKHHILPRSLGGSDDPDNLVKLTPEDHFFAHLLLAKIHGGKMWSPVAFMVGGSRKDYKPIESRKTYAWVKVALAKSKMREGAYQFDHRIHKLKHKDGRTWQGLQSDMPSALGMKKSAACLLIKEKYKSSKGWYLDNGQDAPSRGGASHHNFNPTIHHLVNVDGRSFTGTVYEFYTSHDVSPVRALALVAGKQRSTKGWHKPGLPPLRIGRDAKGKGCAIGEHGTTEIRLIHSSGERFRGTRREFAAKMGCCRSLVTQLVNGKVKSSKGWTVDHKKQSHPLRTGIQGPQLALF